MPSSTVLLVGGTGRVGRLVLNELLDRGATVRALVRSSSAPADFPTSDRLHIIPNASILDMPLPTLSEHARGCSAIVCTLGHPPTLRGIYGAPYRLVTDATRKLSEAAAQVASRAGSAPIRLVVLNSLGVNAPGDAPRTFGERIVLALVSALVPPFRDSMHCARYLNDKVGKDALSGIEWAAVRPSTFATSVHEVEQYSAAKVRPSEAGLFAPTDISMESIAHFMAMLATADEGTWAEWRGTMPALYCVKPASAAAAVESKKEA
ncbi:hypothetical protein AMAG_05506 [Allomyces macrogynus ATCC 38327]|uniref:NAD(P)-binding domain-containing protein n=1 Tax=Allomyces macrogynus (strain ATCC 38327) TaxID=578462 RepID=A0A0L0SCG3_ALLM3|nr:hypothetical protein AMAG_05506 [Allomyces macrogynus ATCC 38327]|eukprot:KNE60075.1 hypothetical protein AMAG_05506 [Allomyces macrogynus ATCC 38327]